MGPRVSLDEVAKIGFLFMTGIELRLSSLQKDSLFTHLSGSQQDIYEVNENDR